MDAQLNETVIPVGAVLAIEPILRIKGIGSVALEDEFILTSSGGERLTRAEIVESIG